jgi:hypothetical protein
MKHVEVFCSVDRFSERLSRNCFVGFSLKKLIKNLYKKTDGTHWLMEFLRGFEPELFKISILSNQIDNPKTHVSSNFEKTNCKNLKTN